MGTPLVTGFFGSGDSHTLAARAGTGVSSTADTATAAAATRTHRIVFHPRFK
ncbi:hypothetical protein Ari01nite_61650 [Paractinoplanes rishiriensis]|uniref:Uncharacterized protein n=1 Tax=Paractinoplanes rishiriensis TaxID=1050105 RepID=A0A919K138_9ACTN|nr:hypothetical protein Ari01nite_61650 [Actinoplanes rishiriensis]